jgi:hypothetical protein
MQKHFSEEKFHFLGKLIREKYFSKGDKYVQENN